MKLIAFTICLLLTTPYALARPSTFIERALRHGSPALPADVTNVARAAAANTATSGNWAGVVLPSPPTGENFTEIVGTFAAPNLAPSSYTAACAWIGIDGWTTNEAAQGLFQAGIDFWMEDEVLTYDAWYEWVPDSSWNFTDFDISAGDVLTFRLVVNTDIQGTIYLENETKGESTSLVLDAPPSPPFTAPGLAMQNAEWIMEDFFWYGQVPLADFGSVVFTNASATTNLGTKVGLTNGTLISLVLDDTVRADVTIDSDSSATITYIPA